MKIRIGFVSNSSTSSFCMYGWAKKDLTKEHIEKLMAITTPKIDEFYSEWDDYIGVGNSEHDLHFEDEGEQDSYTCEGPTKEEMAALDVIAKEMNLPAPDMQAATWYNG